MCFNSVLIPPVNRGPRIFLKFELHQNGIFFASFEVQFAVINYSFEPEFWYIYVLYWINLLLRIFFLARDRSLKLNTSFPVLYFDEVSMYNVIEFEFSKTRDTDRPVPLY